MREYGAPPLQPGESEWDRRRKPQRPEEDKTPSAELVIKFHQNAPVDNAPTDIHHTLGPGVNQAAAGSHDHRANSSDSKPLFEGVVITGSRGGNAALFSVIQALVQLGAKDTTTT